MRKIALFLFVAGSSALFASTPQSTVSQTARQALIEMFFSKTPGTFLKHLPTVTRAALEKSGALANLQQYSLMMNRFQAEGQNVQTFDTGSILLSGENLKTGDKVEITVENDALRGDQDDLDLSFQLYKNGQKQATPFNTQFIFSMKLEDQIWKLNEISVTVHVPLADPALLKTITDKMAASNAGATLSPRPDSTVAPAGSDAMVTAAMKQIVAAEATYAATYPTVGYTCTLSDLDGFGGGEPNEHQAMLINSGLASGKRYGFLFALSGCGNAPARGFRLTATPNANSFGRTAWCADQSSVIRSSAAGNPASCLSNGTPIQ